jgi:hypothetical protein
MQVELINDGPVTIIIDSKIETKLFGYYKIFFFFECHENLNNKKKIKDLLKCALFYIK